MPKYDISQHQFKKGFDPNRNIKGAPRKLISSLADLGYTNRQISNTILGILALTKAEVERIAGDESFTMLERLIANALLKDFGKGSLWNVESILSRAIGRPKETTEIQNEKIEVVFIKGKTIL
ncbi:MAG: hypothetical protein FGM46_09830 [Ferruginibacter sp.]|nr:hypothetical protein [Ferruginibacter sp.]